MREGIILHVHKDYTNPQINKRKNFGMENFKMIAVRFASGGKGVIGSTLHKDGNALGVKREDNLEMQTKNNQLSIQKGPLNSCL